jgi:hypothetical protein
VPTSAEPSAQITMEPSIADGTTAPTKVVPTAFLSGTSLQSLNRPVETDVGVSNDAVIVDETDVEVNHTNTDMNGTYANQTGDDHPVNVNALGESVSLSSRRVCLASTVVLVVSTIFFAIL